MRLGPPPRIMMRSLPLDGRVSSSKSEFRSPKSETNPKPEFPMSETPPAGLGFGDSVFGFVSDFEFRRRRLVRRVIIRRKRLELRGARVHQLEDRLHAAGLPRPAHLRLARVPQVGELAVREAVLLRLAQQPRVGRPQPGAGPQ